MTTESEVAGKYSSQASQSNGHSFEAYIEKAYLFFLLSLLDENLAKEASEKLLFKLSQKWKKQKLSLSEQQTDFVSISKVIWRQKKKKSPKIFSDLNVSTVKIDVNFLSQWMRFCKLTNENHFMVILWSQILSFSEESIAKGLEQTTGTIYYRLSVGLKELGDCSES